MNEIVKIERSEYLRLKSDGETMAAEIKRLNSENEKLKKSIESMNKAKDVSQKKGDK